MIRINLLPSEERSSKRKISLPTISGGAILWVTLGVFVYAGAVAGIWVLQSRKITDYETRIQALKEESDRLAPSSRRSASSRPSAKRSTSVWASSPRSTRIVICTCA